MSGHTFHSFDGDRLAVPADDHLRRDVDCFADEVVVDFPSVARAVDRIRRAFLEEHSETVRAAVRLSAREAREGVLVPVRVPLCGTCKTCGGRGETWAEACEGCSGSGTELLQHRVRVLVPAGVIDGSTFAFTVAPSHSAPTRIELSVLVA